jgi:hypothetical protein
VRRELVVGMLALAVAPIACAWLLYREVQWRRRKRWMGHYEQPVEGWAMAEHAEAGGREARS